MRFRHLQTKKLVLILILACFCILVFIQIFQKEPTAEEKFQLLRENDKFEFEQIGYFKSDNNNRVFTFYINTWRDLDIDSIPEQLWEAIKVHGNRLMHTSGVQTHSYYYTRKVNTPDITLAGSFVNAVDKCYEKKPIALVLIGVDGKSGFIKYPD
jgi:hypothetical protein